MKLTNKQAAELLKVLTAQAVEIVGDDSTEAEKDFTPQGAIDKFLAGRKPVFQKEFEDSILPERLKAFAGEIGGKLRSAVRKASGNQIKLADMEGKTDDEVVQMLADHLATTKDADANTLREQIKKLVDDHKAEFDKLKAEHATALTAEQKKFTELKVDEWFQGLVKGLPLGEGDAVARAKALKAALADEYGYVWDETKKVVELREKDKPESPVIKDNMVFEPKTFAESYFKALGMVKSDTSGTSAAAAMGNNQMQQAAQQNAQQFQQMPSMPSDLAAAIATIETAQ